MVGNNKPEEWLQNKKSRDANVCLRAKLADYPLAAFYSLPRQISKIEKGWSKSLASIPRELTEDKILKYLLSGSPDVFTTKTQHNRLANGREVKRAEHFLRTVVNDEHSEFLLIVHSWVSPSFSVNDARDVTVVIERATGCPCGAQCDCKGASGECCSHVSGLLLYVADLVKNEFSQIPDDELSATDKPCQWSLKPKQQTIAPKAFRAIPIRKRRQITPAEFFAQAVTPKNDAKVQKLVENLKKSYPICAFLTAFPGYGIPLSNLPVPQVGSTVELETSVPQQLDWVPAFKMDTYEYGLNQGAITQLPPEIRMTAAECKQLERSTVLQLNSTIWENKRKQILTSSRFHEIMHSRTNTMENKAIRYKSGGGGFTSEHMENGIKREPDICRRALEFLQAGHPFPIRMEKCGLVVNQHMPFLGASPDRVLIFERPEGIEYRTLEVKCASTCWLKTMDEYLDQYRKKPKLEKDPRSGEIKMVPGSDHFDQVQGQLALTGCKTGYYCVATLNEIVVLEVPFDSDYWKSQMLPKLHEFYIKCYV